MNMHATLWSDDSTVYFNPCISFSRLFFSLLSLSWTQYSAEWFVSVCILQLVKCETYWFTQPRTATQQHKNTYEITNTKEKEKMNRTSVQRRIWLKRSLRYIALKSSTAMCNCSLVFVRFCMWSVVLSFFSFFAFLLVRVILHSPQKNVHKNISLSFFLSSLPFYVVRTLSHNSFFLTH